MLYRRVFNFRNRTPGRQLFLILVISTLLVIILSPAAFTHATTAPKTNILQHSAPSSSPLNYQRPVVGNMESDSEMLEGPWMKVQPFMTGRSLLTSVALSDGSVVLMGGTRSGGDYHDVQLSSDGKATWWRYLTGMAGWSARSGHTSVALPDDSIVLMGGRNGIDYNDVWRSTDQGATWTEMTAGAAWAGRRGHTSAALPDGSIILMGGEDDSNHFNDVWRSTDQGATWTQMTASAAWTARNSHTSVVLLDGSIVLMGGHDGSYKHDVWRSTDQGTTWTQMTSSAAWHQRSAHTSAALPDGSIILIGGFYSSGPGVNTWYKHVWRSTDQGVTWTIPYSDVGIRTDHTSMTLPDGSIVVMGGRWGGNYKESKNDVKLSTDQGANWTEMTFSAEWADRFGHSSVVLPDDSLVLMGGRYKSGYANDVRRSTDQGATWVTMTNGGAEWSGRSEHTSVVLPDGSIVLMGGYSYEDSVGYYYNDVWRSTDQGATWTEMTASAEWTGRHRHTSLVLPDDSIILMGGYSDDGANHYYNDVWRSTDNGATWTQITASAEWTIRKNHTSVLLPDDSIVLMGGYMYDGTYHYYNDVWRSTDNGITWTEITPSAEWGERGGHTTVVLPDGSLVLIAGDDDYDQLRDVWLLKTSSYTIYLPLVISGP